MNNWKRTSGLLQHSKLDVNQVYIRPYFREERETKIFESEGGIINNHYGETAYTRSIPTTRSGPQSHEHEWEEPGETHALPTPSSLHLFWSAKYARPACSWDPSLACGHGTQSVNRAFTSLLPASKPQHASFPLTPSRPLAAPCL